MRSTHATWRPVPYTGLHARQPHRAALIHTNDGGTDHGSLFGWWSQIAKKGQHVGAHFQVATSGHAEQYVDTSQVIYHAYAASEWAVGIETEDDGHPATPWTDAQMATIVAICHELQVPARLLTSAQPADGLGWHEQFTAWNKDGHDCPGTVRERQIRTDILPALAHHVTPARYYTVQRGDSLASIAKRYSLTVADVEAMNPGIQSHPLTVGQRVKVRTGTN